MLILASQKFIELKYVITIFLTLFCTFLSEYENQCKIYRNQLTIDHRFLGSLQYFILMLATVTFIENLKLKAIAGS